MAAVAGHNQQQPLPPSSARDSPASTMDYSREASAEASPAPPPPPQPPTSAPATAAKSKAKGKKAAATDNPVDAHKALLSKISQLEASSTENAHEAAEIEAEVKKANRDLSQLLNTMEPHNSKLDIVQRKYSELLSDMKKVERDHAKAKKRGDQLQKEKEEIGKERTRERGLKEKLEKLSRELTRENKKLKEDLRDLRETSADRSEELHRRLESMVLDVEDVLIEGRTPERQTQEVEQDRLFREKFTSFLHQYELRELQFQSLMRIKDLEIAYHVARHDQLKRAQESELSKSTQLTKQVSTFSQTESELRGQLNVYVEKFKQVEDTLNNSNDLFLTFRKEMEEMSKKTKRLEKENLNLTRKQEATNKNIFQMAEERSQSQQTIDRLTRENEKLKKLCRAMQTGGYTGAAGNAAAGVERNAALERQLSLEEDEDEAEESDYDEEYDEDDDGEYDDEDTEEEGLEPQPRAFGPPPPPPPPPQEVLNGKVKAPVVQVQQQQQQQQQVNGAVNGARH